jgi:hypothetical protein
MSKENRNKSAANSGVRPPEWLRELLDAARASADFQRRCEAAATLARNINRLREANRERAFERIPLRLRVMKLAKENDIPLASVLRWFGIRKLSLADSEDALARFSRGIGFSPVHFLDHLRIGEAQARGYPVPVAGRGFRKSLNDLPWDRATLTRIRAVKEALDAEYSQPED